MTTTRLLRRMHARHCLRLLQGGQTLSRADMARALGVTRATIGYAVAELTAAGLVLETPAPAPTRLGRPGVALRLNPQGALFIGIEMDTRAISGVLLDLNMQVVARKVDPTGDAFHDPQAMLSRLMTVAQGLAAQTDPARLIGLGVAVPGLVGRQGQVVNAPLLGWRDFALQANLQRLAPADWQIDVCNDAFAFASAERAAEAEPQSLLMVLLAEGVGSAYLDEGRMISGAHGFAGELGHMIVSVRGRAGPLEAMAGAAGFPHAMRAGMSVAQGVATLLASLNTPQTQAALDLWTEALAIGLANAAHLLDPDRIVLGGPLSALYPHVADRLKDRLAALMLQGHATPSLHLARYGDEGAAIGAAARLRARMFALPDLADPSPKPVAPSPLSPDRAACQTQASPPLATLSKGHLDDQQT